MKNGGKTLTQLLYICGIFSLLFTFYVTKPLIYCCFDFGRILLWFGMMFSKAWIAWTFVYSKFIAIFPQIFKNQFFFLVDSVYS